MVFLPNKKMRPASFSLFLFFLLFIHGTKAKNLIHETCRTCAQSDPNINYTFCASSLQAAPASRRASVRGLGSISITLIEQNVTDTRHFIKHLMGMKLDSYVKECLSDCFDLYTDAIDSVQKAREQYNSKQYDEANVVISTVLDATSTCEGGFTEKKGLVSPLT
ncbi:unnamed protein product, partial [Ilex paraguariensis]